MLSTTCLFSTENRSGAKKNSFINDGRRYYPIVVPNTVRTGNVKAQKFIESMVKVKVDRFSDRARFNRKMAIMRTDKSFEELMEGEFYNYVDLIRIESAELIDEDDANYDIFADELTNSKTNVSMFNQYIQIEVNPDCLRFKDAVKKRDHIENECWINTLLDHYADSLMRHKRGKLAENLTREAILKLIRKSDEEFKTRGASISDMHKVFKEFNIKARLYDIDGKQIYRHDPKDFNSCRIVTFNALVKNSHVYTLNYSLESLKAKTKDENPNNLKIGNNFFINNKRKQ